MAKWHALMNRFEGLTRVTLWLCKRDWGLSFLLAFASFWAIVGIGAQWPGGKAEAVFEGPLFSAGVYVGTIVVPNHATRGTTGFYVVPLFGAAADFLVLMAFWFIVISAVHQLRAEKKDANPQ
jgi:hypothetical protein